MLYSNVPKEEAEGNPQEEGPQKNLQSPEVQPNFLS